MQLFSRAFFARSITNVLCDILKQFTDHDNGVIILPVDQLAYQQGNIEDIRSYSFFFPNEYV